MKQKVKKIDNLFVRYGILHLTKQKGYGGEKFHSPPASIGFYAMPYRFQEMFLAGCIDDTQKKNFNLPKKLEYDNIIKEEDDEKRNELYKEREEYYKFKNKELRHKFYVDDDDLVWHHLFCPHNEVIDMHNSWIKTTISAYKQALKKENIKLRAESLKIANKKDINSIPKNAGYFSKDHFEVFFDTKVY